MECNNCKNKINKEEQRFKDPIRNKDVCQECIATYGYDTKIKAWGQDITHKRWKKDNTVEDVATRNKITKITSCIECISKAKYFIHKNNYFFPVCEEHKHIGRY